MTVIPGALRARFRSRFALRATRATRVAFVAALFGWLLTGCGLGAPTATPEPTQPPDGVRPIEPPFVVGDFTMTDQYGMAQALSVLNDRPVLIAFGYTHCPDVCPVTLANFVNIKRELGDSAAGIRFVFVSVDGGRDTPARLGEYLSLFDPEFLGLTGDEAAAREAGRDFGVTFTYERTDPSQTVYNVSHTASTFLVDRGLGLRRIYSFGTDPAVIARDLLTIIGS